MAGSRLPGRAGLPGRGSLIFLTIGTHEPFDRLVRAVDEWCAARGRADVFGQITDRAIYLPRHFEHVGQMAPAAYRDAVLDLCWSCYKAGPVPCGSCASCLQ